MDNAPREGEAMDWLFLFLAGATEVLWTISMKQCAGFTKFWPSVMTLVLGLGGLGLLTLALRTIPMGTAYAIWSGIGIVGAAVVGIIFYRESPELIRLVSIAAIVIGIVGLKLTTS
jgi:quaternary ammonium compound-resistance protein SugE